MATESTDHVRWINLQLALQNVQLVWRMATESTDHVRWINTQLALQNVQLKVKEVGPALDGSDSQWFMKSKNPCCWATRHFATLYPDVFDAGYNNILMIKDGVVAVKFTQ